MDIKRALEGQYTAAFKMLRQCIERCPDDLWTGGDYPRETWRIAYHALYYSDLYLKQTQSDFVPWSQHRDGIQALWNEPDRGTPYSKEEAMAYLDSIVQNLDADLSTMDIAAPHSGISWYPDHNKLENQILNVRHLAGHVGQLSELLMGHGIEVDWQS